MLVLLGILVGVFILLAAGTWFGNRFGKKRQTSPQEEKTVDIPPDCCGAHEVCEVHKLRVKPDEIVYFEDEELDRFRGTEAGKYSDSQIEEFRDILYTLKSSEIRMWLISIQRRNIELPTVLKPEALQLIAET
ncbi:MAG: hypothetical protein AB7D05_09280 [Mangrovibacterium sp.]